MQNKLNLRLTLTVFTLIVLLFSKSLSIELIKSFLGMFIFIYLPFQFGESIIIYTKYLLKEKGGEIIIGSREILIWLVGVIMIIILSFILSLIGIFNLNFLIGIIILTIIPFVIFYHKFEPYSYDIKYISFKKLDIILLLANAIIVAFFFRSFSPFPLQPTWDTFSFMFRAERILDLNQFYLFSNFYSENLFRVGFSVPSLPLLLAIASKLANSNPLFISWSTPFFFIPIYSLGIYLFSYFFTKNRIVSISSSIFGVWMTETSLTFGVGWLYTAPLVMLMFPFIFVFLSDQIKNITINFRKALLIFLLLILLSYTIHLFLGPLMVAIILFYKLIESIKRNSVKFSILALIIIIFLIVITQGFYLDIFGDEIRSLSVDLNTKISLLFNYFTPALIFISLIGLFFLLASKYFENCDKHKLQSLGVISISLLFFYLSPISFIYRINMFLHLFIAFFSGLFLLLFIENFKYKVNKKFLMVSLSIIIIIIFSSLHLPIHSYMTQWTNNKDIDNPTTSFMSYDLEMASWIENNLPRDILIVSEPSQQHLIGGLIGTESLEGGHQMSIGTQRILKKALLTKDSNWTYKLLCDITPERMEDNLLIISGRVFKWSEVNYLTPIYVPFDLELAKNRSLIEALKNNTNLEFLHSIDDQIYAFKYTCK